jgi:hypothetical protein
VDAGTGAVRWSTDRWQYASPLGGARILGYGQERMAVLDGRTGHLLWQVDPQWTEVLLPHLDPRGPAGAGDGADGTRPALLGRRDAVRRDRYWLAPLVPAARPLGYLTGLDWRTCEIAGDLLACSVKGRVGVWRYR